MDKFLEKYKCTTKTGKSGNWDGCTSPFEY